VNLLPPNPVSGGQDWKRGVTMEENKNNTGLEAGPEQVLYAAVLEKGMYIGLFILFITFALYVFGIMEPYIPLEEISTYWSMGVHDYLQETSTSGGWSWLSRLNYGDFINFVGVVILAGVTIVCYIIIIPLLLRRRDFVYAVLAVIEVAILALAASGLLAVGGH
jgi:hypothetical protein